MTNQLGQAEGQLAISNEQILGCYRYEYDSVGNPVDAACPEFIEGPIAWSQANIRKPQSKIGLRTDYGQNMAMLLPQVLTARQGISRGGGL
jgi:hypothetical protein